MERKTFLAIVLSFIFLLSYNALVIEPQQKQKVPIKTEVIDNKQLAIVDNNTQSPSLPLVSKPVDDGGPQESLENDTFRLDFSAKQGNIKSLTAKSYHYSPTLADFLST